LRKPTITFVMSVLPSVRTKFDIRVCLEKLSKKFRFH